MLNDLLLECGVIPPNDIVDRIKNVIEIGNIRNSSNCIYTLLD